MKKVKMFVFILMLCFSVLSNTMHQNPQISSNQNNSLVQIDFDDEEYPDFVNTRI